MVAIQTKFLGPTNYRGSRYKAFTTHDRKTVTIHADDSLNSDENHHAAARAYCKMMGWTGVLAHGGTDTGNVYVFIDRILNKTEEPIHVAELVTV